MRSLTRSPRSYRVFSIENPPRIRKHWRARMRHPIWTSAVVRKTVRTCHHRYSSQLLHRSSSNYRPNFCLLDHRCPNARARCEGAKEEGQWRYSVMLTWPAKSTTKPMRRISRLSIVMDRTPLSGVSSWCPLFQINQFRDALDTDLRAIRINPQPSQKYGLTLAAYTKVAIIKLRGPYRRLRSRW